MKQTTYLQKNASKRAHSAEQGADVGSLGVALAPPTYGIDLVDQQPIQRIASAPRANHTGLPDNLKAGIEHLAGLAMDDVRVHYNSTKPAQLQALAYTQNAEIHLGLGQERYLPHEAWHVVQQKQGRVRPTSALGKAAINDNSVLEREADAMGMKAGQISLRAPAAGKGPQGAGSYHPKTWSQQPAKQLSPALNGTIQRAIAIGAHHLPRTLDQVQLQKHFSPQQIQQILSLHAERDKIYIFENEAHFINYFTTSGGFPPLVQNVAQSDLESGHTMANMLRFGTINKPATNQFPTHAPGAHAIPPQQLPPSGPGHQWATTTEGANQQYTLWSNKLQPPTHATAFHTFGDPNNPSIWTSQGQFNMGGRVMPAPAQYLVDVPRSQTTYGYLNTETGYVRGHPMSLAQQQISTDPTSNRSFDNTTIVYTRESDGTKGGFSTFRYNAVENPATQTNLPFNQVNVSSNPQGNTQMGIPPVDTIHISALRPGGNYEQMTFDNTVDYRTQIGSGNKFHARLQQHVQSNNFPYEPVYQSDQDYEDPDRHTYPGYMSPPPTPFLTPQLREEENNVALTGRHLQNEIIIHNNDAWLIVEASYNTNTDRTTCKLQKAFTKQWTL